MNQRLPPLQPLQTFAVVAATGSFTAAAKELHLSQSAVSRQIQQLEHYFGEELFARNTRKVMLSHRGQALLPLIENFISSLRHTCESTRLQLRTITVRMGPTFARRWFLPRLPRLQQDLPELNVQVDSAWFVQPQFTLGEVDLAIVYGNGNWPGMEVIPLAAERLTPVCAADYPGLVHGRLTPADLRQAVLLHANHDRSDWTHWLQAERLYDLEPHKHQVFDTMDFTLTAAGHGYGIAMGDLTFIEPELERGVLLRPFERMLDSGYGYYALYPSRAANQEKVADFVDWLAADPCVGYGRPALKIAASAAG